nr:serine acetyltransferase [uncultured Intestinibacter sp.]
MNNIIKDDLYRLYGNKENIFRALGDFRFLYMLCWRKIVSKSKLTIIYKLILKSLRKHYHIEIPYTVSLGRGFSMDHAYNITINSKAIIGNNVTMYKGSTIGMDKSGVPTIGNNVYIGLNSTIVGGVVIGNDVLIAPNTYINFNVPNNCVVIGNPGKIHKKNHATNGYLINVIDNMENKNEKKFN